MVAPTTKPIDLNPDSPSFADIPEGEREALSQAFQFADIWTKTVCRQDYGDGQVFQDEFIAAVGTNPKEFQERSFSASRNLDFARFRDDFDYLPDFTKGKFVKVTTESQRTQTDLAAQGSEDVWVAFDEIWKKFEPLYDKAEGIYARASMLTDAASTMNAAYRENGGQKNITKPVLDAFARGTRHYDQYDEIFNDLVLPAMNEAGLALDSNSNDRIAFDLEGLEPTEKKAVSAAIAQCKSQVESKDSTPTQTLGFDCMGFLFAYDLSLAYENGLDEKMVEQYPLF